MPYKIVFFNSMHCYAETLNDAICVYNALTRVYSQVTLYNDVGMKLYEYNSNF